MAKKEKKESLMYFPSFKVSVKNGTIVFGSAIVVSGLIVCINYGMNMLMSMI